MKNPSTAAKLVTFLAGLTFCMVSFLTHDYEQSMKRLLIGCFFMLWCIVIHLGNPNSKG